MKTVFAFAQKPKNKEVLGKRMDVKTRINELMLEKEPKFIEIFEHLHRHPEVAFEEYETTAFVRKHLETLGIEILDYGLETGVVAQAVLSVTGVI